MLRVKKGAPIYNRRWNEPQKNTTVVKNGKITCLRTEKQIGSIDSTESHRKRNMESTPTTMQKEIAAISNGMVSAELFGFSFFSFCFPAAFDGGG